MSNSMKLQEISSELTIENDQKGFLPQKGQMLIYEKEEAEVIRVSPLLVIKTKNRVVCGDLWERFENE